MFPKIISLAQTGRSKVRQQCGLKRLEILFVTQKQNFILGSENEKHHEDVLFPPRGLLVWQ